MQSCTGKINLNKKTILWKGFKDFLRAMSLLENKIWLFILIVLLYTVSRSLCHYIIPGLVKRDVLNAALHKDALLLNKSILVGIAAFIGGIILVPLTSYFFARTSRVITVYLKERIFSHIVYMKMEDISDEHSGDLISRATNDINTLENFYGGNLLLFIFHILHGILSMIPIFIMSPLMGYIIIGIGFLTVALNTAFAGTLRKCNDRIQRNSSVVVSRLVDIVDSLPVTKILKVENKIHNLFSSATKDVSVEETRLGRVIGRLVIGESCISMMRYTGLAVFGLYLSFNGGGVQFADIIAIIHIQASAMIIFDSFGGFIRGVQRSLSGLSRIFELLDAAEEEKSHRDTSHAKTGVGKKDHLYMNSRVSAVEISNLVFSYDGKTNVLDGVNINAEYGKLTALAGPSGSGKSTLIKLLLGLVNINELPSGRIAIFGKDISDYDLHELRSMSAYVPQDPYLFNLSIRENIALAKPDATMNEIEDAAIAANAHDFIMQLPDKYDTLVGERGGNLSGGQRQRIAIARAFIKNAPLLLLDEATSSLDTESEQLVQEAINRLMKGRTVITIAHRHSTISSAEMIYVIKDGKIVESGLYDEVLAAI